MRSRFIFVLCLALLAVGVRGDDVSVTVNVDGKKPRTVNMQLPPAEAIEPSPAAPVAPTNLQAAQVGTTPEVHVSWTDNSTTELGFAVERSGADGAFQGNGIVGGDVRDYADKAVVAGSSYSYRVRAFNNAGASTWSNVVQVQVLPPPPTDGGSDNDKSYDIPASYQLFNGNDFSSADGQYKVKAGDYTLNSLSFKTGVDLRAITPGSVVVHIPKGKQATFNKNVTLCGITFVDGGVAKDTNGKNAMLVTNDGVYLHTVRVTKAVGVGILMKGTGLTSWYLEADHNGTSGRMMMSRGTNQKPGSGYTEMYPHLHHNNIGGKKSDAANKGTQTSEYYSKGAEIDNEDDGGQWFDISCWNCVIEEAYIHDIKTSAEWFRGVGVRFELNCYGTYPSGVYRSRIERTAGSAFAANESSNLALADCVIGKCYNAAELRQLTRDDDPGDGGTTGPWPKGPGNRQGPGRPGAPAGTLGWVTYNINFARNHYLVDAGPITLSDAGSDTKKIKQSTHQIKFTDEVWDGGSKVKIPK